MDNNRLEYVLAKSCAGHDKGSWYAVISRDDVNGTVEIADGRRRKLCKPKRKNIKHVEVTGKKIELRHFTDKSLREALWELNYKSNEAVAIVENNGNERE